MSSLAEPFQLPEAASYTNSDSDDEPIFFSSKNTAIPLAHLEELMRNGEDDSAEFLIAGKHSLTSSRHQPVTAHHMRAVLAA